MCGLFLLIGGVKKYRHWDKLQYKQSRHQAWYSPGWGNNDCEHYNNTTRSKSDTIIDSVQYWRGSTYFFLVNYNTPNNRYNYYKDNDGSSNWLLLYNFNHVCMYTIHYTKHKKLQWLRRYTYDYYHPRTSCPTWLWTWCCPKPYLWTTQWFCPQWR